MNFSSASSRRGNSSIRSKSLSSLTSKTNATRRRKKQPPWDNSVTNLGQYKSTREELALRHEQHRPNLSLHRFITSDTSSYQADDTASTENSPFTCRKVAVQKEYLSPGTPLQTRRFLQEIDQNISLAEKSLPANIRKYQGHPVVTSVPDHLVCTDEERSLIMIKPLGNSYFGNANQSAVKQKALNEISDYESADASSDENDNGEMFGDEQTILGRAPTNDHEQPNTIQNKNDNELKDWNETYQKSVDKDNLTVVNKNKNKHKKKSNTPDVDELRLILNRLEMEIEEFERKCGRENILKDYQVNSSVSGYTISLLNTLIRVTHHMKEQEVQLQEEVNARELIMNGFEEQRALIDALTVDLIHTEEDNSNLRTEMEVFKKDIMLQMKEFKEEMTSKRNENYRQTNADSLKTSVDQIKINKENCESDIKIQQIILDDKNRIANDEQLNVGPSPSISPIPFLSCK